MRHITTNLTHRPDLMVPVTEIFINGEKIGGLLGVAPREWINAMVGEHYRKLKAAKEMLNGHRHSG